MSVNKKHIQAYFFSNCFHWIICLQLMTFCDNISLSKKRFFDRRFKKKNTIKNK